MLSGIPSFEVSTLSTRQLSKPSLACRSEWHAGTVCSHTGQQAWLALLTHVTVNQCPPTNPPFSSQLPSDFLLFEEYSRPGRGSTHL